MNRILLLLEHRENRRLLSEWLQPRYQVIELEPDADGIDESLLSQSFDLCIIGPRTLDQLWQAVQVRRSAEQPVLLPFLLSTSRQGVKYGTRYLWKSIDELITQPIEKLELQARVEILLRSRQLSLQLQASKQITAEQIKARQQAEVKRDRAISAQRYSDEQFLQMAEIIPSVFWLFDLQTQQMIYLSPAYQEIWGRSREELYDDFSIWIETVHPDDRPQMRTAPERCIANGRNDEEYRIIQPDGAVRWIRDRGFSLYDAQGQPCRLAGVAEDITDRKYTELALQESEQRYRDLAEAMPQIVGLMQPTGEITYLNQQWYRYTGLSEAESLGFGCFVAVHPDDRERIVQSWQLAVAAGQQAEVEYRLRRRDGMYRWFVSRAVPRHDRSGQIASWIGTVTDIDDQKRGQEAAERANRVKDEFLAVLSHELRTPMNPILGWATLLQRGKLDAAKTTQALATIERNAKLQVQLIDDLLDISRILRGMLTLTMLPVDLSAVVMSAIDTVRLAIDAKAIRLNLRLSPEVGYVLGDTTRLQQVVWNLITNAVKFTPADGEISIELIQVENQAQIQVRDSGKGIQPDFLPHVFEHFRQEDGATTRKFGGLGLGLAIVRQIVEMHGGMVRVESPGKDQGATFTVCLPLMSSKTAPQALERSPQCTGDLSDIKILVVDDDPDSREFIAFALEQAGATVTVVGSGSEALQSLIQSPPDLLISDIGMPEMDGYALMQQIRSLTSPQGKIPAIALTAYAGEADEQRAYQVGFQKHMAKPIDPVAGVAAVSELIRSLA
ncbi:MAG: PAS domain-containing protein [Drouetiella hepatica Uher 2000/2452]|jgi:PAS domain S-box-containing protein|uniref:histidine kinase n=1 Tax=Drouetiella hepatica Uher 2000/2452 TaxID=904376 RepID=A0A951ULR6_9CYAN|nr:PAS domain-containing protein [Drouetiella hepatica Uher 2000/2452]